jgi:hypothetical protein
MKEYNLRERAEIVSLAQQVAESLKAQPLIDWFEAKLSQPDVSGSEKRAEVCDACNNSVYTDEYSKQVRTSKCYKCGK